MAPLQRVCGDMPEVLFYNRTLLQHTVHVVSFISVRP